MSKRGFGSCLWCIVGDFNTVRRQDERKRVIGEYGARDMEEFNLFIRDMELIDIPLVGKRFTWFKSDDSMMSRLDRVLVSESWSAQWGVGYVEVIPRDVSDHCPLILNHKVLNWGPKPFRFNNYWLSHSGIEGVVGSAWEKQVQGTWVAQRLRGKLLNVKNALKKWNVNVFGNVDTKIKSLTKELKEMDAKNEDYFLAESKRSRQKNKLSLLAQKARVCWGKYGDLNSKYFHACIRGMQQRNQIIALKITRSWLRPRLSLVGFPVLSNAQNARLVGDFTEEEVSCLIRESGGDKSPGLDGFNFAFLKRFWPLIKVDVMDLLAEFHTNLKVPKALLSYFVTLVPKVPCPQGMTDFHPISLLRCLYKIISKVLANKLRGILPSIILENQSAFIPGRHMLDSVLVAAEAIDYAQKYKKPIFVMKIYYEKAYDSVE
uniref:Transposon TX1 uncharacterized n=1 Tax=Cajanus cajan TaxID=3821 RepID=A0A151U6J6_CAJCA|nr:Transposon TX1 uncharacterized [Cajanus cajan]